MCCIKCAVCIWGGGILSDPFMSSSGCAVPWQNHMHYSLEKCTIHEHEKNMTIQSCFLFHEYELYWNMSGICKAGLPARQYILNKENKPRHFGWADALSTWFGAGIRTNGRITILSYLKGITFCIPCPLQRFSWHNPHFLQPSTYIPPFYLCKFMCFSYLLIYFSMDYGICQ